MCLMNKVSWNELPLYLQNYLICLVLKFPHGDFGMAFHPSHSFICWGCQAYPDCVTSWQEEEITRRSLKCEIKFLKMTHLKQLKCYPQNKQCHWSYLITCLIILYQCKAHWRCTNPFHVHCRHRFSPPYLLWISSLSCT